jgi:hypothetical protein
MRRVVAWFAAVPGIGAVLLPVGACPACWPAYAGLLGSVGLGFLLDGTYLFPLSIALLALALSVLGWHAPLRHGYGPLALGLVGSALALGGRFAIPWKPSVYVGAVMLLGASLWNGWPRRAAAGPCPRCAARSAGAHAGPATKEVLS